MRRPNLLVPKCHYILQYSSVNYPQSTIWDRLSTATSVRRGVAGVHWCATGARSPMRDVGGRRRLSVERRRRRRFWRNTSVWRGRRRSGDCSSRRTPVWAGEGEGVAVGEWGLQQRTHPSVSRGRGGSRCGGVGATAADAPQCERGKGRESLWGSGVGSGGYSSGRTPVWAGGVGDEWGLQQRTHPSVSGGRGGSRRGGVGWGVGATAADVPQCERGKGRESLWGSGVGSGGYSSGRTPVWAGEGEGVAVGEWGLQQRTYPSVSGGRGGSRCGGVGWGVGATAADAPQCEQGKGRSRCGGVGWGVGATAADAPQCERRKGRESLRGGGRGVGGWGGGGGGGGGGVRVRVMRSMKTDFNLFSF